MSDMFIFYLLIGLSVLVIIIGLFLFFVRKGQEDVSVSESVVTVKKIGNVKVQVVVSDNEAPQIDFGTSSFGDIDEAETNEITDFDLWCDPNLPIEKRRIVAESLIRCGYRLPNWNPDMDEGGVEDVVVPHDYEVFISEEVEKELIDYSGFESLDEIDVQEVTSIVTESDLEGDDSSGRLELMSLIADLLREGRVSTELGRLVESNFHLSFPKNVWESHAAATKEGIPQLDISEDITGMPVEEFEMTVREMLNPTPDGGGRTVAHSVVIDHNVFDEGGHLDDVWDRLLNDGE